MLTRLSAIVFVSLWFSATLMGQPYCNDTCTPTGHFNYSAASYPYTEDITAPPGGIPLSPSYSFTTVQSGCTLNNVQGKNLRASETVNVMLHAMISLSLTSTVPVGSPYEVQLLVDGVQYGWYARRVRVLDQQDFFEASIQNLSAGDHTYELAARLLPGVSGQLIVGGSWITATGAPASNPSAASTAASQLTLTPSWQVASDTLTFSNATAVDMFLNGYAELDYGTPGEQMLIEFELDGNPGRQTAVAIPPQLYAGINFVDHLKNVPPGTHTLRWSARTTSTSAGAAWRNIGFVSFPAFTGSNLEFTSAEASLTERTTVSTTYNGPQPSAGSLAGCGPWTPILTVPVGTVYPVGTSAMSGYIQIDNVVNPGLIQFAITQDQAGYELGLLTVQSTPTPDGFYIFSDASTDVGCAGCSMTLWARRVLGCAPGAGPGSFDVLQRFLFVKFVYTQACRF